MNTLPKCFNYIFYSTYYDDLNKAFGYNQELLENHYLLHGRFENRKYCNIPDNFDWKKYISNNPEIFDTIETVTKDNSIYHFLQNTHENTHENSKEYLSNSNTVHHHWRPPTEDTAIELVQENSVIFILYYAFLNNDKDWRHMIKYQLFDVYKSGVISVSKVHAVLLGTPDDIKEAKLIIESVLKISIEITEVYENKYEFPALIKIRELALEHSDKLFIYIHSKGMVNHNLGKYRIQTEQRLTLSTLLNWESTLYIFEKYPTIQKAGLMPAEKGWIWFNFWWARASYIISCSPIEVSDDRFVCENWLGENGNQHWNDSYSLINNNISFSADPSTDIWTKTCNVTFYC